MSIEGPASSPIAPIEPEPGVYPHQLIVAILLILLMWQTVHYYPLLPERVGSTFDGSGMPIRYSSREFFFGLMWGVIMLMQFAFFVMPRMLGRLNPRLLNIPNKEYWLAPEHLAEALRILTREMGWFGVSITAFLIFTMQLTLEANLHRAPLNNGALITGLILFMSFTVYWIIRLHRLMAIPPSKR